MTDERRIRDLRSTISYLYGLVAISVVMGTAFLASGDYWLGGLGVLGATSGLLGVRQKRKKLRTVERSGAST